MTDEVDAILVPVAADNGELRSQFNDRQSWLTLEHDEALYPASNNVLRSSLSLMPAQFEVVDVLDPIKLHNDRNAPT